MVSGPGGLTTYKIDATAERTGDGTDTAPVRETDTAPVQELLGTVSFVSDSYRVKEPTWMAAWRTLVLQVVRSGDTSAAAEGITAMPAPGTADDWDFVAARTPLRFEAGSATAKFEIMARDDPFFEDEETFTIALSADPGSGYRVGSPSTATVTIVDGTIAVRFSQDAYTVTEGGNAEVTINLSTSADVPAPFEVSVADSTATRGSDYSGPETITVTIPAGDTSKTFSVPITDDSDVEQPETFTVTLKPAPNLREYYLQAPSAATITINDNDTEQTPPEEEKPQTVTVAFSNVPSEHDGRTAFALEVQSGSKPARGGVHGDGREGDGRGVAGPGAVAGPRQAEFLEGRDGCARRDFGDGPGPGAHPGCGRAREGGQGRLARLRGDAEPRGVGAGVGGLRDGRRHGGGGGGLHGHLRHAELCAGRDGEDGLGGAARRRHRRGQGDVHAQALEPAGGVSCARCTARRRGSSRTTTRSSRRGSGASGARRRRTRSRR